MEHRESGHRAEAGIVSGGRLIATIIINFTITAAEVIGGIVSNSLALLSDALHNLSDGLAIVLAYYAFKIASKESNLKRTFGYRRAEILAALINSLVLIAICFYLFYEAFERFFNPEPIKGTLMLIVASIGLAGNLASVLLLNRDKSKNINVKAAYLHLLGDTMSSVVVIIGGVLISIYSIYWIDPLLTFLIGIYILKETYSVISETIDILMQTAPRDIDISEIREELKLIPEIKDIHHVHLWKLDDRRVHFECHIELSEDMKISRSNEIIAKAEKLLYKKFDINHSTLQIEFDSEHDKKLIHSSPGCC